MNKLIEISPLIYSGDHIPPTLATKKDRQLYIENNLSKSRLLENYQDEMKSSINYPLYILDNSIIYMAAYNDDIVFYNSILTRDYFNIRMTEQESLWRNRDFEGYISRLAAYVFWKYVLNRSKVVITNRYQFTDGITFWKLRVLETLHHTNYYSYKIDIKDENKTFRPITKDTWLQDQEWLWGTKNEYKNRRIVISKNKLD